MNTYLTIMVTVLVATQIIRITQNHISLRRQEKTINDNIAWLNKVEPTEWDFENQREVFRMLRYKLASEEQAILKKCDTCGWLGDDGTAESGGESPCAYCLHNELWCPKESEAADEQA